MTASINLRESVAEAPVKKGDRYRVIVARPGQGSSGFYSEDVFRRDAHKIIAPGGQAFIGHDESRSVKDLIGVYPEGARWSEEDKAVVADLQVFEHWKAFVEEVAPHVGISLYARGTADEDGNVLTFEEDPYNGADLVARPGLAGSQIVEKLAESARAHDSADKPGGGTSQDNRKEIMEEKLDQLIALMTSLVAKDETRAAEAAQVKADEAAVVAAVEQYDSAVKAIDEADLLPSQVASLRAEAKKGVDVAPLIEAAKQVKADAVEAAKSLQEDAGQGGRVYTTRTVESAVELGKVFG